MTLSPSMSGTPSQSQTVSPSLRPFQLFAELQDSDGTPLSTPLLSGIPLSDSLPPVTLSLKIDRCPEASLNSPARALCIVRQLGPAVAVSGASQRLSVLVAAPSAPKYLCPLDNAAAAPFPLSVVLGADFGTSGGYAMLECEIANAQNESLARSAVPLSVSATEWPLWDDALVVVPSIVGTGALLVRSVRYATTANATTQLLAAHCGSVTENCSLVEALDSPDSVLAGVYAAWSVLPPPPLASSPQAFVATIVGSQIIVLRASAAHTPAFFPGVTTVTIGGVTCTVRAISPDGAWLMVTSPQPSVLCNATASGDCGYVTFVSRNVPEPRPLQASSASAPPTDRGAAVSCPPFCPGSIGSDIPVAVVSRQAVSAPSTPGAPYMFVRASPATSTAALPVLAPAAPVLSSSSQGFYYAAACDASGFFESPVLGACANDSDPLSYRCAWGVRESCTLCPREALCPGGARLWSRPGHWVASESSLPGDVATCAPPDPASRCLGWDAFSGSTLCGVAYRQGSYLCGACAPGFFAAEDASCAKCPASVGLWARYQGAAYIIAAILAVIAVFGALLFLATRLAGPGIWKTEHLWRLLHLGVWAFTSAQVISDVAIASSQAGLLPPLLSVMYARVAALQFEGGILPAACTGAYPFQSQVVTLAAAVALWTFTVVVYYCAPGSASNLRFAGQITLLGALLVYAQAAYASLVLINCKTVVVSAFGASGFDGGSSAVANVVAGSRVTVSVLVSEPAFVCWAPDGSHRLAGILAAVTLAWVVVGMPLLTLVWLLRDPWVQAHRCLASAVTASKRRGAPLSKSPEPTISARRSRGAAANPRDVTYGAPSPLFRSRFHGGNATAQEVASSASCSPTGVSMRDSSRVGGPSTPFVFTNPIRAPAVKSRPPTPSAGGGLRQPRSPKPLALLASDDNPLLRAPIPLDSVLQAFFYVYKPSTGWYMRHVDLFLLLVLSALRALLMWPSTLSGIVLKASLSGGALVVVLVLVIWTRPFIESEAWMGWVRSLLLVDSLICVVLNALAAAVSIGLGGSSASLALIYGSIVCFVLCTITFASIFVMVALFTFWGAKREALRLRATKTIALRRRPVPLGANGRMQQVASPPALKSHVTAAGEEAMNHVAAGGTAASTLELLPLQPSSSVPRPPFRKSAIHMQKSSSRSRNRREFGQLLTDASQLENNAQHDISGRSSTLRPRALVFQSNLALSRIARTAMPRERVLPSAASFVKVVDDGIRHSDVNPARSDETAEDTVASDSVAHSAPKSDMEQGQVEGSHDTYANSITLPKPSKRFFGAPLLFERVNPLSAAGAAAAASSSADGSGCSEDALLPPSSMSNPLLRLDAEQYQTLPGVSGSLARRSRDSVTSDAARTLGFAALPTGLRGASAASERRLQRTASSSLNKRTSMRVLGAPTPVMQYASPQPQDPEPPPSYAYM